jgi:anti-sigma B factor antagonist
LGKTEFNAQTALKEGFFMENIRIETSLRHREGVPILDVAGEIDIYTTPQFKEAVSAAIDAGMPAIVINMTKVTYMDSSGFGTLLSATKRLRPVNGGLHLSGCNDAITRMLQITRLNTIFGVHATEEEAIQAALSADSPGDEVGSPVAQPA